MFKLLGEIMEIKHNHKRYGRKLCGFNNKIHYRNI
jgi:hypothetical protein